MYFVEDIVFQENDTRVKMTYDDSAVLDAWSLVQDSDSQVPLVMVPWTNHQRTDLFTGMDKGFAEKLQNTLKEFEDRFDNAHAVFQRWAKAFHNTDARVFTSYGSSQGDMAVVVLWPDTNWLETVGLEKYIPTEKDMSEFVGYLWGNVYTFTIERHDTEYDVWYEIGSHGIVFGETEKEDIEYQAREALDMVIVH